MAKRPASQSRKAAQEPEKQGPASEKQASAEERSNQRPANRPAAKKPAGGSKKQSAPKKAASPKASTRRTAADKPATKKDTTKKKSEPKRAGTPKAGAKKRVAPPTKPATKQGAGETAMPESMRRAIAAAGETMQAGQANPGKAAADTSAGLSGLFRRKSKSEAVGMGNAKTEAANAEISKPETPKSQTRKKPAKKAEPAKKAAPARKAAPKTPVKPAKPTAAQPSAAKPETPQSGMAEQAVSRMKTELPPLTAERPKSLEPDIPKAVPAAKAKIPVDMKIAAAEVASAAAKPKPATKSKTVESEGRAKAMKPAKTSAAKKADAAKQKADKAGSKKKSKLKAVDKTGKAGQKISEKPEKGKSAGKARKLAEPVKEAKAKRAKVASTPAPARVRVVEPRRAARRPEASHPSPDTAPQMDLAGLAVAEARQPKLAVESRPAPAMAAKPAKQGMAEVQGKPARHDKPVKPKKKSFYLPQTTRIALLVRDPWHVHLYWDLGREDYESHGFGALHNAPLLVIRLMDLAARRGPMPRLQRVVLPRAGSLTCEVPPTIERWVAQIGLIGRDGEFIALRESNEALMPGATSRGGNENGRPLAATMSQSESDLRSAAVREAYRPDEAPAPRPFEPLWNPAAQDGQGRRTVVAQPAKSSGVPASGLDREWTSDAAAGPQTPAAAPGADSAYTADWAIPEETPGKADALWDSEWDEGALEAVKRITSSSDYALLLRINRERGLLPGKIPAAAMSAPASVQPPAPAMPGGSAHLAREITSSEGRPAAARDRGFWMRVHTELLLYGATEPDAKVTVMGEPVELREDGSFSLRFALPDGDRALEVRATSADGIDSKSITPVVHKHTEYEQPRLPESRAGVVRK